MVCLPAILAAVHAGAAGGPPPAAPTILSVPAVDNTTPRVGDTLHGTAGTYTGSPTLSYQWHNDSGPIDSAAGGNNDLSEGYTVQDSDDALTVWFTETATNAGGTVSQDADPTSVVTYPAPVSASAPSLSDDGAGGGTLDSPNVGDNLSMDNGGWVDPQPDTFAYLWGQVDVGNIDGATAAAYAVQPTDSSQQLQGEVDATYLDSPVTRVNTDISGPVN